MKCDYTNAVKDLTCVTVPGLTVPNDERPVHQKTYSQTLHSRRPHHDRDRDRWPRLPSPDLTLQPARPSLSATSTSIRLAPLSAGTEFSPGLQEGSLHGAGLGVSGGVARSVTGMRQSLRVPRDPPLPIPTLAPEVPSPPPPLPTHPLTPVSRCPLALSDPTCSSMDCKYWLEG